MLEQIKTLLSSSDPATLIGSAAVAVFIAVNFWRKVFPSSWNWLEAHIPLIDRIKSDVIWTLVWKMVQAIPGAAIGAVMTALASGGDVKKTLLGALAGPVASLGHELLKRYKGQTSKPGDRGLPPASLAGAALIGGSLGLCAALALPGCGLFAANSPLWPIVTKCAPSVTSLVDQVIQILIGGGDVESELLKLAQVAGKDAVICAAKEATESLKSKVGATPERLSAGARGDAFLAKSGNR